MFLTLFMFFPVGNIHYQMILFVLAPLAVLEQQAAVVQSRSLRMAGLLYGAWVALHFPVALPDGELP